MQRSIVLSSLQKLVLEVGKAEAYERNKVHNVQFYEPCKRYHDSCHSSSAGLGKMITEVNQGKLKVSLGFFRSTRIDS